MEKLSDFIKELENGVSYNYATAVIDELTQEDRGKIHDMCVLKAAVSRDFPPIRYDLSRLAEYIKQNYTFNDERTTIKTIPLTAQQDIMTDRAKKYFEKAIGAGYMEKAGSGYKWTFPISRGAKAALCYFIMKVYSPNPRSTKTIHYKALEQLFSVKRLDSATGAMWNAKNPQEWRGDIDSLFND